MLRVPVPWGAEPKAQVVSGFNHTQRWHQDNRDKPRFRDLDELFGEVEVEASYKAPPIAIERGQALSHELPELPAALAFAKALQKAAAPRRPRSLVSALPAPELSVLELPPPSLFAWATSRGIKLNPRPETFVPQDPFATRSKVRSIEIDKQQWSEILPPSLLEWAVARGIPRTPVETLEPQDPFATRTKVIALERRRQLMVALKRGEWCLVDELDFLPPRLRDWLIETRCRFIRYVGGGRITPTGTPVNGYVTEDGVVFYVAEDGSTFYVQET